MLAVFVLLSCVKDVKQETTRGGYNKPVNIDIDSDIEDSFNQAVKHLKAQEYDQAIALLTDIIQMEKRAAAPYVNLGMAYDLKGDVKQAEEYLQQAVSIDLAHPVANNQLGLLYRKQGRFDDARKAYTNALSQYPDYLPVRKNLGILCELYLRDFPCAMEQYEYYQKLRPDDKSVNNWVVDLSRRMGR